MIRMADCEVVMPATIEEARYELSTVGARIIAGGTDLVVSMKHGMAAPDRLVWLGKIRALHTLRTASDGALHIGAACTLAEVASSEIVRSMYPSLAAAAYSVASPAIRTTATIGGNLCLPTRCVFYDQSEFWRGALGGCIKLDVPAGTNGDLCHAAPGRDLCSAIFSSDIAPLLMALNANITVATSSGRQTIPIAELYSGDGATHLSIGRGDILVEIVLPAPSPDLVAVHRKLRQRGSIDFPLANLGLAMRIDHGGLCRDVRMFAGAIHSMPVKLVRAGASIEGNRLDDDVIAAAAAVATKGLHPIPNSNVTVGYRRRMLSALVERALVDARTAIAK